MTVRGGGGIGCGWGITAGRVGGGGTVAGKGGDCLMLKSWSVSFPTLAGIMNYLDISHSVM